MTFKTTFKSAVAAVAVSLALGTGAAVSQEGAFGLDASVIEAARAEGALTFYSAQAQDLAERTAAAFEEAFPASSEHHPRRVRHACQPLLDRVRGRRLRGRRHDISNLELFNTIPTGSCPCAERILACQLAGPRSGPTISIPPRARLMPTPEPHRGRRAEDLGRHPRPGSRARHAGDPRASNTYLNWSTSCTRPGEEFIASCARRTSPSRAAARAPSRSWPAPTGS